VYSGTAVSGNLNTIDGTGSTTDVIETTATENYAVAVFGGNAVSGNVNDVGSLSSGTDKINSTARDNYAYSGYYGTSTSGNELTVGGGSNLDSVNLNATDNEAIGYYGANAVSGNKVSSSSNLAGGQNDNVDLIASGNTAVTDDGKSVSGNDVNLGRIGRR